MLTQRNLAAQLGQQGDESNPCPLPNATSVPSRTSFDHLRGGLQVSPIRPFSGLQSAAPAFHGRDRVPHQRLESPQQYLPSAAKASARARASLCFSAWQKLPVAWASSSACSRSWQPSDSSSSRWGAIEKKIF